MDFNRKTESPLARQGSVYNLTFDQFQNSMGGIGKDFGSMNMDELLKNIWTAEETQAMASATQVAPRGGIQRQGSLTLPRTLSQKTVDEVWKDLVRENTTTTSNPVPPPGDPLPTRQQTLGEMTLEEFLVRAGVDINLNNTLNNNNTTNNINNNNNNNIASSSGNTNNNSLFFGGNFLGNNNHNNNNINNNNSVMPMAMPIQAIQGYGGDQQIVSLALTNGMMPGGMMSPKGNNGEMSSSLSPVNYPFARGKKSGGQVEKVVERRQRRMIKNRESAARSRARKQAYTIELEAEVAKLKEQNEELQKKQAEIMEMQKNQPKEVTSHQCGPKKRCLRRTQTGPW